LDTDLSVIPHKHATHDFVLSHLALASIYYLFILSIVHNKLTQQFKLSTRAY